MEAKRNEDFVGYYEAVIALINPHEFGNSEIKAIEFKHDYENSEMLTFQNVLDECKRRGYNEETGTILLLLESFLGGKIYRYGNYRDDKWYEVGSMIGFA